MPAGLFLGIDPAATSKAMPMTLQDGTVVLALIRGDDRLEDAKLDAALGVPDTNVIAHAAWRARSGRSSTASPSRARS